LQKFLNREADVTQEAVQFRGTASESEEPAAGLPAQVGYRAGLGIAQFALHGAVAQILRVQVRSVGRHPLDLVVGRVAGQELLHRPGLVGRQAVPHDDQRAPDAPPEIAERREDLRPVDAAEEMAGV
jgi:hypothetical protein